MRADPDTSLAWVGEACALMLAGDASMAGLARWLGVEPAAVERDRLLVGPGTLPGIAHVSVLGVEGVPDSLSAWYAPGAGPTIEEAGAVLGPPQETNRVIDGPYRVAFPRPSSPSASCLVAGSTWDPPGDSRRLVEVVLRRDPL